MEVGDVCYISAMTLRRAHLHRSVWRICVGLSLVPAFGTLYQRLTLPESKRYEEAQHANGDVDYMKEKNEKDVTTGVTPTASEDDMEESQIKQKAHFKGN